MRSRHQHVVSNSRIRQTKESVLCLLEIYRLLDKDLIDESLREGRMSGFLFEADEAQVVASAKEARDATMKSLDDMAEVGKQLNNSEAVATFVDDLRVKLAKIVLDSGKFASLKDFAGITIKQISYINDSLTKGMKSIDSAVDALVSSLDTLKIDFRSARDTSIEQMINSAGKSLDPTAAGAAKNLNIDQFKKAIEQKMAEITGKGSTGFFASIMGMIKGASSKPITMNGMRFSVDLLSCTGAHIDSYLKGTGPKLADEPKSPASDEVAAVAKDAGVDQGDIERAKPAGNPPAKIKVDDLDAMSSDEMKSTINRAAKAFGASGDIVEQIELTRRNVIFLSERWLHLAGIKEDDR